MFIGHFGVGLGAKKAAPRISLGTLFLAAQFLDLLWPTFLLLGWEHVAIRAGAKSDPLIFTDYPISHSLLTACGWGFLFGLVYFLFRRNFRESLILGLCVLSHWVLDLLVHHPDLPLFPGHSPLVGLGLWNHMIAETIIEILIFIIGLVLYLRTTVPRNKTGKYALWGLVAFLLIAHLGSVSSPAPTSVTAIAWTAQLQWLIVIWGYWADRNRTNRPAVRSPQPA